MAERTGWEAKAKELAKAVWDYAAGTTNCSICADDDDTHDPECPVPLAEAILDAN